MTGPNTANPRVLGIDPGLHGALAWVGQDGRLDQIEDMPVVDDKVNAALMAKLIIGYGRLECAVVEEQQAFPKRPDGRGQGTVSAFKTGVGFGIIIGVLGALEIPTYYVRPAVWKKVLHLPADKEPCRKAALDRWPNHSDLFRYKKNADRAEAALIAVAWLQSTTRAEALASRAAPSERPLPKRRLIPRLDLEDSATVD
jgi:crossover junction endodeoxyribonuclease RuvC